ncbi:hypothetical protein [Deinococcus peraridilitoris]|uniref:Uncharacterized protein n=1 Tax=Deinococcus peraridilitoris (strain DSM 19664 / LMG 22246 / CIP 109416 / KR-200) TaxID=937777 RepID=L0A945_DEIPD|nr:hypothetical protein [Deinococcus peraridilitoris]AFZ69642.1 hypothetical protein Deipe_4301 [Deinococcus peraridilitoris DSM 19664]
MKHNKSMSSMPTVLLGVVIGAVTTANAKGIAKTAAKGFMAIEDVTSRWTAGMREGMRDAVAEAKHERETAARWREHQLRQMYAQQTAHTTPADSGNDRSAEPQDRNG